MKRIIIFAVSMAFGLALVVVGTSTVRADDTAPMTEAHIERIRTSCIEAQTTLHQIHTSDTLLRVNRGQLYEWISTRLMAQLDSRIALNHLDGANLTAIAAAYETQLNQFRNDYQAYDTAMSAALKIDCTKQPVAFYDSVVDARTKREKVHDDTEALQQSIKDYKAAFETFASKVEGATAP